MPWRAIKSETQGFRTSEKSCCRVERFSGECNIKTVRLGLISPVSLTVELCQRSDPPYARRDRRVSRNLSGPDLDICERRRIIGRALGSPVESSWLTIPSAELFALQNAVAKPMGSKQDDHNRGERDGSKASGLDAWVDVNNPLNPEEYKAGYRHGLQQQRERSASI